MSTALRMKTKCVAAVILGLVTITSTVLAADVTGSWNAEFDTMIGVQKYTFTFTQDGGKVTGKAASDIAGRKREAELREARLDGDTVAFVEILDFQGNELRITYKGTISGDEIKFTRRVGEFGGEEFVATRGEPKVVLTAADRRPAAPPERPAAMRGRMRMPQPGPCPLPILPALPAYDDTSFYAVRDVPLGKVEQVTYRNFAGRDKRMHIYLPPDYDKNADARYPVLYLNHGGGDDDSKWTNTDPRNGGHAQFILDNLIADGKAKPAILVMPNTRGIASGQPPVLGEDDACTQEYLKDIIPYVDSHYRTKANREGRALAGLSMGGFVVLHTGLSHLDTFSELYVYSSGHTSDGALAGFEENFRKVLEDPNTNGLFRVPFYMAAGETDIALRNSQRCLALFNKNAIRNFWVLSSGGHEWANWRRYLYQTAQIMFPESSPR